ncbi:DUF2779 domain-containing protein [Patescibacteria group bacterium]|nr:DUF2779 domain-containing protein [Patescibacteria group bacterium]MCG2694834.1 DUF2779 domain-containing protein [Candidatus Parcubacteria bacterium]
MKLSKTNYLIYRDCGKNAWVRIHRPDVFKKYPLSAFEEGIIETGNEVDILARNLFPGGVSIDDRYDFKYTKELMEEKTPVIYQPVFETEKYQIACDIMVWNKDTEKYDLYEVKASNSGEDKKKKDELYTYDIAFQYIVLKDLGIPVGKLYLTRLNCEYVRRGDLNLNEFFTKEDFTERVLENEDLVREEMRVAYDYLFQEDEPNGFCSCITKGRNGHCTTFEYSNPGIPKYSVHDISRIGLSKRKLEELIDSGIYDILNVPEDLKLSDKQSNQISVARSQKDIIDREEIKTFLDTIEYPIAFFDYETFPSAIPRFDGYSPYNQIPFQFSVHILEKPGEELKHKEFIYTGNKNPDEYVIKALQELIPGKGSVIVWYKSFEMSRNKELGKRNPDFEKFLSNLNDRVVDLEEPFKNQFYVHPHFKGKTSIKYILPALVPELSYKKLEIQEGGTASNTWNKIVTGEYSDEEIKKQTENLLRYCELDTLAMVEIFDVLQKIIRS